jgi:hypothetical protein
MAHRHQRVAKREQHQQQRQGEVDLAQYGEPGRVGPDEVRHGDDAQEQRRDAGGRHRSGQVAEKRGDDQQAEEGRVDGGGGSPLPVRPARSRGASANR